MFLEDAVVAEFNADLSPFKRALTQARQETDLFGSHAAQSMKDVQASVDGLGLRVDGLVHQFSRATRLFGAGAAITAGLNAVAVVQGMMAANTKMASAAIGEQIAGVESLSAAVAKVPMIGRPLVDIVLSGAIEAMEASAKAVNSMMADADRMSKHMEATAKWVREIGEAAELPFLSEAEKLERTVQRMRSDLAERLEGPGFSRGGELTATGEEERRKGLEAIADFERSQQNLLTTQRMRLEDQVAAHKLRLIGNVAEAERMEFMHGLEDTLQKLHAFSPEIGGAFMNTMDDAMEAFDLRGLTEMSAALDEQEGMLGRTAAQWQAYRVSVSGAGEETIKAAQAMANAIDERTAGVALAHMQRAAERSTMTPMDAQIADFKALGASADQIDAFKEALEEIERSNALKEIEVSLNSLQTPLERLEDQADRFVSAFKEGLIDKEQLEWSLTRLEDARARLEGGVVGSEPRLAQFIRAGSAEAHQLQFLRQAGASQQDQIPRQQLSVMERVAKATESLERKQGDYVVVEI